MDAAALEPRLAAALADQLARSAPFSRWFFARALPPLHPLTSDLPSLHPELAGTRTSADGGLIEVTYRHAEPDWTILFVLAHHITAPLTAAHAAAARDRAKAAVAAGECKGACVLLLSPRRVARDSAHTDSFHAVVTHESIAEHLGSPAAEGETDDPTRSALSREFLAATEHQVRVVHAAAVRRSRAFWDAYDEMLRPFAAHLRVLKRDAEPGSDVWFDLGPTPPTPDAPKFELVHHIRAARATLHVSGLTAADAVAARMALEMPRDLYLQHHDRGLMLWQRVPPLRTDSALTMQVHDVRHALMLLCRLRQWRQATLPRWSDWRGPAPAAPAG